MSAADAFFPFEPASASANLAASCSPHTAKGGFMGKNMHRYESPCTKYIYDPEVGDHESNIPPGTPFEDLPDDWCCPKCGAEKDYFEELAD